MAKASKATIWHNPRCSKSRETKQLLEEQGVELDVRLYLEAPPDEAELKEALKALGKRPRDLLRAKEDLAKELGLSKAEVSDADILHAMAEHPVLIERPVVFVGNKARIGRPPEDVLELLE